MPKRKQIKYVASLIMIFFFLLIININAAEYKINKFSLNITSQIRLRYEHYHGYGLKGYNPIEQDNLLLERIRINFSLNHNENKFLFIQLQDAHAFLTHYKDKDFQDSNPIEDNLDIRQFYFQYLDIKESGLGFRIGRQEISYGEQRIFGPGAWGNTGRYAWDAIMFKYNSKWIDNDIWVGKYLTYKSDNIINKSVKDFITFVEYAQFKNLPFKLDIFYVYKKDKRIESSEGRKNLFLHTLGFQAEHNIVKNNISLGITFAYQQGTYKSYKVNSYGLNTKIKINIPIKFNPELCFQFTKGSGDKNPNDNKYQTFDGVYGGRDISFYGYLNLFFWANLREYELDFKTNLNNKTSLFINHHYFQLDKSTDGWYSPNLKIMRRDISGNSGISIGTEIDTRMVLQITKQTELMFGGGILFPGTFIKQTGVSAKANWLFIQASIWLF